MAGIAVDRRFNPSGRKYEIQTLWHRHHEICRLAILGMKSVDIAKQLDITEASVSLCLNSAVVKEHLHIMRMARDAGTIDIAKQINEMAPKAIMILDQILDGQKDATVGQQIDVAKDVLDRSGFAPPKVIKGEFAHAYLTRDDIEEIKRLAKENSATANVVEAEVV